MLAKRRQNQLAKLRAGAMTRTPDGFVLAACWCGESEGVMVHETVVGSSTSSCGKPSCADPKSVRTRFELRLSVAERTELGQLAAREGATIAEVIRKAIYQYRRTREVLH